MDKIKTVDDEKQSLLELLFKWTKRKISKDKVCYLCANCEFFPCFEKFFKKDEPGRSEEVAKFKASYHIPICYNELTDKVTNFKPRQSKILIPAGYKKEEVEALRNKLGVREKIEIISRKDN